MVIFLYLNLVDSWRETGGKRKHANKQINGLKRLVKTYLT